MVKWGGVIYFHLLVFHCVSLKDIKIDNFKDKNQSQEEQFLNYSPIAKIKPQTPLIFLKLSCLTNNIKIYSH